MSTALAHQNNQVTLQRTLTDVLTSKKQSVSLETLLWDWTLPDAPERLLEAMMQVQPATALQGPQLSAIRSADSKAVTQAVTRLLGYVAGMFNFAANKNLSTLQVSLLANEIVNDYWQLKFDEVVYVLRQGAKGKYHTFDRLDSGVIHGWFTEYQAERNELLTAVAHNESVLNRKQGQQDIANVVAFVNQHALPDAHDVTMEVKYAAMALQSFSDEDLERGLKHYTDNPHKPGAAVKREAAAMVLEERRVKAALEETRLEEQRAKARALIGEYDAATLPAPEIELEAAKHFAAQRGIPKLSDVLRPTTPPMQIVREPNTDAA